MNLRNVVTFLDKTAIGKRRRERLNNKSIASDGEREALRGVRRRAIESCVSAGRILKCEDNNVYQFICTIYEDHVRRKKEYEFYLGARDRIFRRYRLS